MRVACSFLLPLVLLTGCTSANMRRDLDVTGEIPRALTLGAFAPTCFFLCFPTTTATQGSVVHEPLEPKPLVIRDRTTQGIQSGHVPTPPKPKAKAKTAPPPQEVTQ